jgi:hypothetical protein
MTIRRTVRLDAPSSLAAAHRAALAALPEHFEITDDGEADAALAIDAAGKRHARVVVAMDTLSLPAPGAIAIPAVRFAPRLLVEPLVSEARSTPFAAYDCVVRLERSGMSGVRGGLLEQLAVLRALTGEALHLAKVVCTEGGYLAEGALGERSTIVALTGVAPSSPGPAFALHAANTKQRLEIEIDETFISRPARVHRFDAAGATQGALIHQNDNRLIWLAVHAELNGMLWNGYRGDWWRDDLAEILKILPLSNSV